MRQEVLIWAKGFISKIIKTSLKRLESAISQLIISQCTAAPCCPQSPYLWICLLEKCIYKPQMYTCGTFAVIHKYVQSGIKTGSPNAQLSAEVKSGCALLPCLSSQTINQCPFHGRYTAAFFTSPCFCWWFHCLKWL